jgi:hypothetical protein
VCASTQSVVHSGAAALPFPQTSFIERKSFKQVQKEQSNN